MSMPHPILEALPFPLYLSGSAWECLASVDDVSRHPTLNSLLILYSLTEHLVMVWGRGFLLSSLLRTELLKGEQSKSSE